MKKNIFYFVLICLNSCTYNNREERNSERAFFNNPYCDKQSVLLGITQLKDSLDYLNIIRSNADTTVNFKLTPSLIPGKEIKIIDTFCNGQLYECEYDMTPFVHDAKCFVWRGFVVHSKDSLSECSKRYKPRSIYYKDDERYND